jgi:hypothetical protein
MTGVDWVSLLKEQPQFADKCDWSKLDGNNWAYLLRYQPQFADKCDKWHEIEADGDDGDGRYYPFCAGWDGILEKQPQLIERCDWGRMKSEDLAWFAVNYPQVADKIDWSRINRRDWSFILRYQPQFASRRVK